MVPVLTVKQSCTWFFSSKSWSAEKNTDKCLSPKALCLSLVTISSKLKSTLSLWYTPPESLILLRMCCLTTSSRQCAGTKNRCSLKRTNHTSPLLKTLSNKRRFSATSILTHFLKATRISTEISRPTESSSVEFLESR